MPTSRSLTRTISDALGRADVEDDPAARPSGPGPRTSARRGPVGFVRRDGGGRPGNGIWTFVYWGRSPVSCIVQQPGTVDLAPASARRRVGSRRGAGSASVPSRATPVVVRARCASGRDAGRSARAPPRAPCPAMPRSSSFSLPAAASHRYGSCPVTGSTVAETGPAGPRQRTVRAMATSHPRRPVILSAMEPIPFALVGTGWRAVYERVAAALPDRFRLTGHPLAPGGRDRPDRTGRRERLHRARLRRARHPRRAPGRAAARSSSCPCPGRPCRPHRGARRARARGARRDAARPGPRRPALERRRFASAAGRIQVAEQYRYQPLHAARLAIVASGRLGTISQFGSSVAHGYHGIDLLRRFLRHGHASR